MLDFVTVFETEMPTINISNTEICAGETVEIIAEGQNIESWLWEGNGISFDTPQEISVSPTANETYILTTTDENGCTFEENALIKSSFVSKATSLPCLSDDSGICFSDLNNEPGIHSARWAGKNKDFDLAMFKVNKEIRKINNPNYNCHFVCSLSLCWPDNYDVTVSGRVDGKFSWPPRGNKGFGYDPIFRPLDHKLTFAEMVPNFKHNISHRSIAFNKLIKLSFPTLNS